MKSEEKGRIEAISMLGAKLGTGINSLRRTINPFGLPTV
jgi:hypothetical protein